MGDVATVASLGHSRGGGGGGEGPHFRSARLQVMATPSAIHGCIHGCSLWAWMAGVYFASTISGR